MSPKTKIHCYVDPSQKYDLYVCVDASNAFVRLLGVDRNSRVAFPITQFDLYPYGGPAQFSVKEFVRKYNAACNTNFVFSSKAKA